MLTAERLFPGAGQGEGREPVQGILLCIRQECQKGQILLQRMTGGEKSEAFGAGRENVTTGEEKKTDLSEWGFHPASFSDAGFRVHLPPPVISRNHAGWCCFAQAFLTRPYNMASMLSFVQMAT